MGDDWVMTPGEFTNAHPALAEFWHPVALSCEVGVEPVAVRLAGQGWADPQRISLLAFSLGALAAPAAQRLAELRGRAIGWTALAYGGSPIGALLAANPYLKPSWAAPILSRIADLVLRPVEPGEHLPHLRGRFLVVGGRDDSFVPEEAARRMRDLAPEPKTIVLLEGGHMGVGADRQALLAEIIAVTTRWLADEKAVNPPPW